MKACLGAILFVVLLHPNFGSPSSHSCSFNKYNLDALTTSAGDLGYSAGKVVNFKVCENLPFCGSKGADHDVAVCWSTIDKEFSAGKATSRSFLPMNPADKGVILQYKDGDKCPSNSNKTLATKIELECESKWQDVHKLMRCYDTSLSGCELKIKCKSPCACPGVGDECGKRPVSWGDWNDLGHSYLAFLFVLQAFNIIAQAMGYLNKRQQIKLPRLALLQSICPTLPGGRPYLSINLDKHFIEGLFLILGGGVFSLLTLYCCNVHRDPGAMHLQLGLFLLFAGIWGLALYYSTFLKQRVYNFVAFLVCFVIALLLVKHEQNNQFLMVMHYILAGSLILTAAFEVAASISSRFLVLLGMGYFVTAAMMVAGTHGTTDWLINNKLMAMDVVFITVNIVLAATLVFIAVVGLFWRLRGHRLEAPADEENGQELLEVTEVKFH